MHFPEEKVLVITYITAQLRRLFLHRSNERELRSHQLLSRS